MSLPIEGDLRLADEAATARLGAALAGALKPGEAICTIQTRAMAKARNGPNAISVRAETSWPARRSAKTQQSAVTLASRTMSGRAATEHQAPPAASSFASPRPGPSRPRSWR